MLNTQSRSDRGPKILPLVVMFLILLVLAGSSDKRLGAMAFHAPPGLVRIGLVVTAFGLSGYMFALSAAIAFGALWARAGVWGRARRLQLTLVAERAIFFFAAIAASGILAQAVKHIVGRSRPKLMTQFGAFHFDPLSVRSVQASFPSGHATTAFAAGVALSFIFPRLRLLWFFLAAAIAASRVVVGAHYPSDVLGGAALGATAAYWMAHVFARRAIAFDPTSPNLQVKQAAVPLGAPNPAGTESP